MRDLMASRWRGQRGRLEVWYTTLTDPATGTGVWLHHELVAPSDGAEPFAHGWAAVFPPDKVPVFARFGRARWQQGNAAPFRAGPVEVAVDRLSGEADDLAWNLAAKHSDQRPLFTFPRWAWERELLPAAQIVPAPTASYTGAVRVGAEELTLTDAPGGTARIYGHGNAQRWAWLHADLGGGDVLEVVAAVSTRPGLRRLRPLPFVRLRLGGVEHPDGDPLLAAWRLRARIDLPTWRMSGRIGDHWLEAEVTQPPERTVTVPYVNPDGSGAVCHNSERATAEIAWQPWRRAGTGTQRRWRLDGTAHAEVGARQ
jgi:hypothetical protein